MKRAALRLNGAITLTSGTAVGGNVVSGSTITKTKGQVDGVISQNQFQSVPENFASAANFLRTTSSYPCGFTPNGTTVHQWSGLVLTGTDPNLNIFAVAGSILAYMWGAQVNVPAGSTVLVNVDGVTDTLPNGSRCRPLRLQLLSGDEADVDPWARHRSRSVLPIPKFPYNVVTGTIIGICGRGSVCREGGLT